MEAVEERVDRLETVFAQFMTETNRIIQRLDRSMERSDQTIVEIRQEIVEIRGETAEIRRGNDELRLSTEELRRGNEDTRRETEELRRSTDEFRQESRRHTLEMAHIADRIGRFAEDFVNPNIPRLAREVFGITGFDFEGLRIKKPHATDSGRVREFDCVIAGNKQLVISEAKLTGRMSDIDAFADGLKDMFDFFPEYRGYALVPIFASLALGPRLGSPPDTAEDLRFGAGRADDGID